MRTPPACLPCFTRQALAAAHRATTDPAERHAIVRETLRALAAADWDQPPTVNAALSYRSCRRLTGVADPYAAEKQRSNDVALRLSVNLRQRIAAAPATARPAAFVPRAPGAAGPPPTTAPLKAAPATCLPGRRPYHYWQRRGLPVAHRPAQSRPTMSLPNANARQCRRFADDL